MLSFSFSFSSGESFDWQQESDPSEAVEDVIVPGQVTDKREKTLSNLGKELLRQKIGSFLSEDDALLSVFWEEALTAEQAIAEINEEVNMLNCGSHYRQIDDLSGDIESATESLTRLREKVRKAASRHKPKMILTHFTDKAYAPWLDLKRRLHRLVDTLDAAGRVCQSQKRKALQNWGTTRRKDNAQ